jgi:single stranded DNA-binding protein
MRGTATFQIHGRIASDPDLITLQNGQVRCVAPVVVNVPWKDKHDEWQEETVWFRMAWFGQAAKRVADRIEKGVPVLITGDIRSYQVEQEDGKKITNYNFRPRFL